MSDDSMDVKVLGVSESGCVTQPRQVVMGCVRMCTKYVCTEYIKHTTEQDAKGERARGGEKKRRSEENQKQQADEVMKMGRLTLVYLCD